MMIANTPQPPYCAVIFSSIRTEVNDGYSEMADLMVELAREQEGFIGVESARNELELLFLTGKIWIRLENGNRIRAI
ncbi:hypothetical protein [Desertivirga brevis]|uniref:hypothetical protein n=1 Tax=Desertivirga brevis TaxID=2810310 RepID=UPI001A95DE65|nr:hypothetical protein [Pedobacter sp. SYSU D00873]